MTTTTDDSHQHTDDVFHTRNPHDPALQVPVGTLLTWWGNALHRTVDATYSGQPVDIEDCWTELAVGTRLAREVTAGRWVVVAQLLRAGAISDWSQVGTTLNLSGPEAAAGFAAWLAGQTNLYEQLRIGVPPDEAEDLTRLANAIAVGAP